MTKKKNNSKENQDTITSHDDCNINISENFNVKITFTRNEKLLSEIKNVLQNLPLKEDITQEVIEQHTKDIYDILFRTNKNIDNFTVKENIKYLDTLDKCLVNTSNMIDNIPNSIRSLFEDNRECMEVSNNIYSPEDLLNSVNELSDNIGKVRFLISSITTSQKNKEIDESGGKKDLYLSKLRELLSAIFTDLTDKEPSRTFDMINVKHTGIFINFLKQLFKIGKIKVSVYHQAKCCNKDFGKIKVFGNKK